jgi:hypothetical protein|tara:strand:- start:141 stop:518 length:378 start_codon:yes stop_codon:yes gene_type:complete
MPFTPRNTPLPGFARKTVSTESGIKVDHVKLDPGVVGEAVDGASILINKNVPKDSELYRRAIAHESLHAREMALGKISYGPGFVRDNGKEYPRKNGMIKYNGTWHKEGSHAFPWEKRAVKAEKKV